MICLVCQAPHWRMGVHESQPVRKRPANGLVIVRRATNRGQGDWSIIIHQSAPI